jgi:hypothetical protein
MEKKMKVTYFLVAWLLAAFMSPAASVPANAQPITKCTIATKDGSRIYRTDTIQSCRVNLTTGAVKYTYKGRAKSRKYSTKTPISDKHIRAIERWQRKRLKVAGPSQNPARFNIDTFLKEASKATSGFVLIRTTKKGNRRMQIVYITDGVYRFVDLGGTALDSIPAGLMVARR